MKKTISKAMIRDTCLQKRQELVDDYGCRVSEMTTDANSQNQSASQSKDRNAGNIGILNTMESELEFVQREMAFLKSLNPQHVNTIAEPMLVQAYKRSSLAQVFTQLKHNI